MKLCKCKKCSNKPKHFPTNNASQTGVEGEVQAAEGTLGGYLELYRSIFTRPTPQSSRPYKSIFTQPTPQQYKTEEVSFHSAAPTMRDAKIDFHSAWNHHFNHLHWIENWNFPLSASRCLEAENAMLLRRTCLMVDWENASKAVEKVVVPTIKIRSPWELSGSSQQRGGS